jgi:hypothetical protein
MIYTMARSVRFFFYCVGGIFPSLRYPIPVDLLFQYVFATGKTNAGFPSVDTDYYRLILYQTSDLRSTYHVWSSFTASLFLPIFRYR